MSSITMPSAITRGRATSCCSLGVRTSAASSLCDVGKDWAGCCAITIKRRRDRRGLAMKRDMPIRPIASGPLTVREIGELDAFLLAEDGLENPMDFYTFDGFICVVLSGPNTIMPSEWLRWVWDQEEGEQAPEFRNEKQAKRILSLLIGHANVLAFTLVHGPQHYEPLFYSHKIEGNSVPIIDEWCCGYVKGIALDAESWRPLIDARPDWFEVIHLYGTTSGWERLKELVDALAKFAPLSAVRASVATASLRSVQ